MNPNSNNEVAFDLWPNYLERKFYDEKEEIPLPDKKNNEEFNPLDFIANKNEFSNNKIGEKDEEESVNNNDNEEEEDNYNEGYDDYHNINNDDEE